MCSSRHWHVKYFSWSVGIGWQHVKQCLYNVQTSQSWSRQGVKDTFRVTSVQQSKACAKWTLIINIRWEISLSPFDIYFEVTMMSTVPCSNTNTTMWYEFITLQWRHMSVMVSQVMVNSTALSTGCWGPTEKTSKLSIICLDGSTGD